MHRSHQNKLAGAVSMHTPPAGQDSKAGNRAETVWYLAEPKQSLVPEFVVDVTIGSPAHLLSAGAQAALAELPDAVQHICRPVAPYLALVHNPEAVSNATAHEQGAPTDQGSQARQSVSTSGGTQAVKAKTLQRMPPCPSQHLIDAACSLPPQVRWTCTSGSALLLACALHGMAPMKPKHRVPWQKRLRHPIQINHSNLAQDCAHAGGGSWVQDIALNMLRACRHLTGDS